MDVFTTFTIRLLHKFRESGYKLHFIKYDIIVVVVMVINPRDCLLHAHSSTFF